MLKFSSNITFQYREVPIVERFAAAKSDGFDAVEFLAPEGASIGELVNASNSAGVTVVLFNAPMGDFMNGGLGLSAVPGREQQFREAVDQTRQMAEALGCPSVHIGPSRILKSSDRPECLRVLAENLAYAANVLGECGIQVLIEPLNTCDTPDVCLSRISEALSILRTSGQPNLGIQFDIYHMAQMENDFMEQLEKNISSVGHIQIADFPGRGEPGSGELDFDGIFDLLERLRYTRYIGTEYEPTGESSESLDWYRKIQNRNK